MAYDEGLAERIHTILADKKGVTEKKMFGGLCYMIGGNMAVGIVKDQLMVRVGKDRYEECLELPQAREMDFTGRVMKGMVYVGPDGIAEDTDLEEWVFRGVSYAASLPEK